MSVSVPDKTVIDLDILKSKYVHDSLPHHLWYVALDCKRRRDAFWRHHIKMKFCNNVISIPLLILSSISGITSVLQVGNAESEQGLSKGVGLPVTVSIFSVSAAVLTALQRYFRYAERSEHSKHMAKNYARISKRIENNLVLVESAAVKMEPSTFLKFMEEVQKDTESLLQETDDMPKELLAPKRLPYDLMMNEVKSHKRTHNTLHTPLSSSGETTDGSNENEYESDSGSAVNVLRGKIRHVGEIMKSIKDIESRLEKASQENKVEDMVNLRFELAVMKDNLQKENERISATAARYNLSSVMQTVTIDMEAKN